MLENTVVGHFSGEDGYRRIKNLLDVRYRRHELMMIPKAH